jgi:hypothetical protein
MDGIDDCLVGTRLSDDFTRDGQEHEFPFRYEQKPRGNTWQGQKPAGRSGTGNVRTPTCTARKGDKIASCNTGAGCYGIDVLVVLFATKARKADRPSNRKERAAMHARG